MSNTSLSFWLVQVVENLNLAGIDHVFVCTALSSSTVFFTHCALRLKRSGTAIPRMELVEVGPSMDLVVRRHRLPNDSLKKEAMKTTNGQPKKKVCASHLSPKLLCSQVFCEYQIAISYNV